MHKQTGQLLAIKQVPVDTDLQEIIKEISIMQQCDSPYVVKYYGSYFKNSDLWVRNFSNLFRVSRINCICFSVLDCHGILRRRFSVRHHAFTKENAHRNRNRSGPERHLERIAVL